MVSVRLTKEEHAAVTARCAGNVTVSEYLRMLILERENRPEMTLAEYLEWCRDAEQLRDRLLMDLKRRKVASRKKQIIMLT